MHFFFTLFQGFKRPVCSDLIFFPPHWHPSIHSFSSWLSKSGNASRTSGASPHIFVTQAPLQLLCGCYQTLPGSLGNVFNSLKWVCPALSSQMVMPGTEHPQNETPQGAYFWRNQPSRFSHCGSAVASLLSPSTLQFPQHVNHPHILISDPVKARAGLTLFWELNYCNRVSQIFGISTLLMREELNFRFVPTDSKQSGKAVTTCMNWITKQHLLST